jgi:hypothetical protein
MTGLGMSPRLARRISSLPLPGIRMLRAVSLVTLSSVAKESHGEIARIASVRERSEAIAARHCESGAWNEDR